MLAELKFVQGAVARKDYVPALTHFQIKDGRILGFNGELAISSPIDLSIEATPRATPFVKAIQTCKEETMALSITPAGKLAVKSGTFRAYIDCTTDTFPTVEPEGEMVKLDHGILDAIKMLAPFIAQDASRPWATGILFRGKSAFATNNIILIEKWLDYPFPVEVNIPISTIKELLRIGEEPTHLQLSDRSATFHFENGRWLKSSLSVLAWPDVSGILAEPKNQLSLDRPFFAALEDLAAFVDERDRVIITKDEMRTAETDGMGAIVEIAGLEGKSSFQITQLLLLEGIAKTIDFTQYPKPCPFYGDKLRGVIVGMQL